MTTHNPPVNGADRIVCADIQGAPMPNPRLLAICILIVFTTLALLRGTETAHAADQCPNAALRAQSNSTQLPDCRAYETVTPEYMEGFGFSLSNQTFSDDGNRLSYVSTGVFADTPTGALFNQYVATRTTTGWTTTAHNPPFNQYTPKIGFGAEAVSADLRRSLWSMQAPSDPQPSYYLREPDGSFTRIGQASVPGISPGIPFTHTATPDLTHVIFAHGGSGSGNPGDAALWEFVGTNNTGQPRRVSVTNNDQLIPGQACFRGMSPDARVIVVRSGCQGDSPPPEFDGQIWARVGGSATVAVSGSECTRDAIEPGGVCNEISPATYAGAAQDGSRVFITTNRQLVNADTDTTNDLYACDIPDGVPVPVGMANPCASLVRVSGIDGARVENVASVYDDGSQVYFVAQGILAANNGTNNVPAVDGDYNLYLWTKDTAHPNGQTRFISKLDDPALRNPQMTPDGRYLVFATTTKLTQTDGDGGAVDVYRYDAQTRAILQLSTVISGTDGDGPFDASIAPGAMTGARGYPRSASVVSSDGSMVVFETDEALSLADTNGGPDVYLWHDGQVSLISGGVGGGSQPWITPSGRDLFFATDQAPSNDFYGDIYDARVGGGFDRRQSVPCSGDACRGQQSAAPEPDRPTPPDAADAGGVEVMPALSLRAVSAAQRRRLAATGKVTLIVSASAPGAVRVAVTTVLAGRTTTVGSARQTMGTSGTVRATLTLSKKARARLAARGALTVRVVVSHSKVALSRTATLRLTKAKVKKARATNRASVNRVSGGRLLAVGREGRS